MIQSLAKQFPTIKVKSGHLFMVLGISTSIISAMLLRQIVTPSNDVPNQAQAVITKPVVVTSEYIPAGSILSEDKIKSVQWPIDYVPSGKVFDQTSVLLGRVAKTDLIAGEPVYQNKLAGETSAGGLPVIVPQGMRALTVAVSEIKGVAGFIKPGTRVDVLATFQGNGVSSEDTNLKVTKTILQNVTVIATAQQMSKSEPEKTLNNSDSSIKKNSAFSANYSDSAKLVSSVTLALTPTDSEKLVLAEETGSIRLALRSEGDGRTSKLTGISNKELLNSNKKIKSTSNNNNNAIPQRISSRHTVSSRGLGKIVEFIEESEKNNLAF